MELIYVGPFRDGVLIDALALEVQRGVPFTVEDEGNALSLLAQPTNFLRSDDPAARAVAAEAAASSTTPPPADAGGDDPADAGEED